jgi:hypothetical protein
VEVVLGFNVSKREKIFDDFKKEDSSPSILVCIYASIKSGIKLTPTNYMVLMDGSFLASLIEQVTGCLRRPRYV